MNEILTSIQIDEVTGKAYVGFVDIYDNSIVYQVDAGNTAVEGSQLVSGSGKPLAIFVEQTNAVLLPFAINGVRVPEQQQNARVDIAFTVNGNIGAVSLLQLDARSIGLQGSGGSRGMTETKQDVNGVLIRAQDQQGLGLIKRDGLSAFPQEVFQEPKSVIRLPVFSWKNKGAVVYPLAVIGDAIGDLKTFTIQGTALMAMTSRSGGSSGSLIRALALNGPEVIAGYDEKIDIMNSDSLITTSLVELGSEAIGIAVDGRRDMWLALRGEGKVSKLHEHIPSSSSMSSVSSLSSSSSSSSTEARTSSSSSSPSLSSQSSSSSSKSSKSSESSSSSSSKSSPSSESSSSSSSKSSESSSSSSSKSSPSSESSSISSKSSKSSESSSSSSSKSSPSSQSSESSGPYHLYAYGFSDSTYNGMYRKNGNTNNTDYFGNLMPVYQSFSNPPRYLYAQEDSQSWGMNDHIDNNEGGSVYYGPRFNTYPSLSPADGTWTGGGTVVWDPTYFAYGFSDPLANGYYSYYGVADGFNIFFNQNNYYIWDDGGFEAGVIYNYLPPYHDDPLFAHFSGGIIGRYVKDGITPDGWVIGTDAFPSSSSKSSESSSSSSKSSESSGDNVLEGGG